MRHRSSGDVAICLLLGLACFLIYNANLRSIGAVDTWGARYLPLSIWHNQTVLLDPIAETVAQGRKLSAQPHMPNAAWWIKKGRNEHFVSLYPIVVPVVLAPLYLPAVAYLNSYDWDPPLVDEVARIMEKLCASLLATVSVMLLYLLLRHRSEAKMAALLTLAYALGTTTWVVSSQALWMHGLGELLVVATLLLLTGPRTPLRVATAGFLCALIACNRQPDVILAAGLGLYGLRWAGARVPLFVMAAALPAGLLLFYNLAVVGHLIGGYGLVSQTALSEFVNDNPLAGIAGLLFSPTHGLFVFSPFLLFVPCCLSSVFRDKEARGLTMAISGAVALQLVVYAMGDWRQGASWGPRWLTDALPILFWMLPPVLARLSAAGHVLFGLACGAAIAIEVVGAFWYMGASDGAIFAVTGADRMRAAWDIRNIPFVVELEHPRVPADLTVDLRGNIDVAEVQQDVGNPSERQLEISGWSLTNGRTPADVGVLVDGRLATGTSGFFTRPDVVTTLGEASPSGWRVTVSAVDLAPGEHSVAALVRAHNGADQRFLKERTFIVPPLSGIASGDRDLSEAAERAASSLADHLQGPGYWLTAYTDAPRFVHPNQEMDTFTNAVMLDIAAPVAEAFGIEGVLTRARKFLSNQIEEEGLVRYHGRPDAPTIGHLGCAITPDADDTALVWRIAPSERLDLLPRAVATLSQFRTPEGLYRTWLAPKDKYRCIDPGADPNPADIGIQMHVLMLLAQADPPAARILCEALRQTVADDRRWIYYAKAPIIPFLRSTDMRKAGCPLQLPLWRLRTAVDGQDVWIEVIQRLEWLDDNKGAPLASSDTSAFLREIASNEFARLKSLPPLLYHNDLSATVRRFYWSEDIGYALWLRLYAANERPRPQQPCREGDATQACDNK